MLCITTRELTYFVKKRFISVIKNKLRWIADTAIEKIMFNWQIYDFELKYEIGIPIYFWKLLAMLKFYTFE